jgi:phosphoribosylformylglycinamidine synthase
MPRARILIRNKTGVFDPEGKVIHGGLERLGYDAVGNVRVGKVIDLEFESGSEADIREQIDAMCAKLLVNPVIEDYSVEIFDA